MDQPASRMFRRIRGRAALAVGVAAILTAGCTSWKEFKQGTSALVSATYEDPGAEEKLAEAEKLAQDGDYSKAMGKFKTLADNKANNSLLAERARYMQAECRRLKKEYPEAVATYNRLLQDFPTGVHRQQACTRMFEIADYWLDDFRKEIDGRKDEKGMLIRPVSFVPNVFDKTRPTFGTEDRALEALEHVHTHDVTGPTADQALFWCGYVNFIRGNFNEADQYLSQLVQLHKDSKYRPTAVALAIQSKNNATGGADYDGRKCAEALRLVNQAEGSMPEIVRDPEMSSKMTKAKLAIRAQQAEKLLSRAEYYERTRHPGSAYFCYELLRRQHAGTRYSDLATARMDKLKADLDHRLSKPHGEGMWGEVMEKWDDFLGREQPVVDGPAVKTPDSLSSPSPLPPTMPGAERLPDPRALPNDGTQRP